MFFFSRSHLADRAINRHLDQGKGRPHNGKEDLRRDKAISCPHLNQTQRGNGQGDDHDFLVADAWYKAGNEEGNDGNRHVLEELKRAGLHFAYAIVVNAF